MAINLPSYSTNNLSFGPGILKMGPSGTTPSLDIGAVNTGAQFKVTRTLLEVFQGSPRAKIKQWAVQEDVEFTIASIEWNFNNLRNFLGAGDTAYSTVLDTLSFGGDTNIVESALW